MCRAKLRPMNVFRCLINGSSPSGRPMLGTARAGGHGRVGTVVEIRQFATVLRPCPTSTATTLYGDKGRSIWYRMRGKEFAPTRVTKASISWIIFARIPCSLLPPSAQWRGKRAFDVVRPALEAGFLLPVSLAAQPKETAMMQRSSDVPPMRRVAVFGNAGGGKSRLARQLAEATGLPLYCLDKIEFRGGEYRRDEPDGGRLTPDDYARVHTDILGQDEWIIDGFGTVASTGSGWRKRTRSFISIYRCCCITAGSRSGSPWACFKRRRAGPRAARCGRAVWRATVTPGFATAC